jgi:SAM-dependent methyltransferase
MRVNMSQKDRWNERYRNSDSPPQAARVLRENLHLLAGSGRALDLACGRGGNALLLAECGYQVDAWDISDVAVHSLQAHAKEHQFTIFPQIMDTNDLPVLNNIYDVIIISYFLQRDLFPWFNDALKPGGLLFYQTFTQTKVSTRGPENSDFRLADQELIKQLSFLQLLVYREEGAQGNTDEGFRDEVMYIGRKPING